MALACYAKYMQHSQGTATWLTALLANAVEYESIVLLHNLLMSKINTKMKLECCINRVK